MATMVMYEFFRDFTFSFGMIEDSPGLDEFEKPVIRNLVFSQDMKIHPSFISDYRFQISETHIETESGWLKKESTIEKGLISDAKVFSQRAKTALDYQTLYFLENEVVVPKDIKMEHLSIKLFMTNKIQKLNRQYSTFMDFLGNLGGVFEIFLFVFAILMEFHHGIELELYFLNQIVLDIDNSEELL